MLNKLPIISSPFNLRDLLRACLSANSSRIEEDFIAFISKLTGSKFVFPTNSGISSFYIILKALQEKTNRKEVVLPAYTAGSLVVAVRKAGLKPVLCDISLKDFNLDTDCLPKAVSDNTLAVICVHMFGIAMSDIEGLRALLPKEVCLIEDCAQSMGSRLYDRPLGAFSDVSFFSFNRGKNLPAGRGGAIATNSEGIAKTLEKEYKNLEKESRICGLFLALSSAAYVFALNRIVYGLGCAVFARFKENAPPKDFSVKKMNNFALALGMTASKKYQKIFSKRFENGDFLINCLKQAEGIVLPEVDLNSKTVYNRFPVIIKDLARKRDIEKRLWKEGIEVSGMYLKPLHHMFDLGYKISDFPNAVYLAEHLLTLPVHPSVRKRDLEKMIQIIRP